ncbi:MAG: tetratricopeptide repeat protein [candidate division WOR-3 bacterium]|nr:MAG: tetratricopeptide repeat protein [candidate division WOR-3 bacterium]
MNISTACILIVSIFFIYAACSAKTGAQPEPEPLPDFDALWDYNNPDSTEKKFQELIPQAQASGNTGYYAELLTQIARTQGLQNKFDEAHETLDDVEKMLTDDMTRPRIRYLLERGRVYNSSGHQDKARPLFLAAYTMGVQTDKDYYAIDAVHMLQIVEPPEKQLDWALQAIDMTEKTADLRAKKWLGPLYNNTGWTYFDMEQYEEALKWFEKSLTWRQEQKDEQGIRIAQWTIARAYRALGRTEQALEMQKTLESEIDAKGLPPDGYVYEEIAECLHVLQRFEEAKPYFRKAHEVLSQDTWLVNNQADRLKRLEELSK